MQAALSPAEADGALPHALVTSRIAAIRLLLGLLQGLVLYFLYRASQNHGWPATEALWFAPLLLVSALIPVLLLSGLGHLGRAGLWRWIAAATLIIAGLAYYDIWRGLGAPAIGGYAGPAGPQPFPSPLLCFFSAAGLYIAHSLILAAAGERRHIASYAAYFDSAWKLLIQIKFSLLFVLASWLVLWLGASLFMLIKLNFLKDLLQEAWFAIPVSAFAFACAMHLTDVRPAIVRGIRGLLLVLLSWILPLALLIVGGFLASLPFTGLAPLWATRHATAVLLAASAVLVVLVNAAFQNGALAAEVARVLRLSARLACLLLLPLVAIASYALGLRIGDYGWTGERIIAACCLLVAGCYAIGYAWAALRSPLWLQAVAPVNIAAAFLILAVLLALFSPLLDPARLSVADQLARLEQGRQSAETFDYDYLRFHGGRYGAAALQQLQARSGGKDAALIRGKAALALQKKNRWETLTSALGEPAVRSNLRVWPDTAHIPPSFLRKNWNTVQNRWQLPPCLLQSASKCDAFLIDFDGDGMAEILLMGQEPSGAAVLFMQGADASWELAGTLPAQLASCPSLRAQLQAGAYRLLTPRLKELEIGGQRLRLRDAQSMALNCPDANAQAKK